MKAVGVRNGAGDANALFIEDNVPDPQASGDRVLVSIKAFGLNRMDIMQRNSLYPYARPRHWGKILGVEFSGLVEALGPDCEDKFKEGDRVFALTYGEAYAQKICVSERMLMHIPPGLTFEEAAGVPETFLTSTQAIHLLGDLQSGQTVLIHAGASGVGQSAIQIARVGGASKVFTTAGTDEKCELCKSLGADFAINYRTKDFASIIERQTEGRGVDLIIDLVGRDYWHKNMQVAAMDSRMVLVAAMSGSVIEGFNLRDLLNKRMWVMATTLRTRDASYQEKLRDIFVDKIMPYLDKGKMRPVIDKVYSWTQVSEAHKRMESNANAGKIICVLD